MAKNEKQNGNGTQQNGNGTTKPEAVKMTSEQTAKWRKFADQTFDAACAELENASPELLRSFAEQGVASRIDNKFSTAAAKLAALETGNIPALIELTPTSSRGEKAGLIAKAFEAIQKNPAHAAALLPAVTSGKVSELREALAAIAGAGK